MFLQLMVITFFACWGSFLNVVAYRLIKGLSIVYPPSFCPHCATPISWYDNIPLVSWCLLGGRCRTCNAQISYLYPCIELFTIVSLYALYSTIDLIYFPAYFLFFSALIVSIRSDLETLLISYYATFGVIPIALGACYLDYLPITLYQSVSGATCGFLFLWLVSAIFTGMTGKKGMGEGDMDLLALIGAFTGPYGVWATILIASVTGSLTGIGMLASGNASSNTRIPFGPFLACGAIIFVLWQKNILTIVAI